MRSWLVTLALGCGNKQPPAEPVSAAPPAGPVWTVSEPVATPDAAASPAPVASAPAPAADGRAALEGPALLLQRGDPAADRQALEALEALARVRPKDPWVLVNLGVARYKTGDRTGANDAWNVALDLDRTMGAAWVGLVAIALDEGRNAEALQFARQGVAAVPSDPRVRAALVEALRRGGNVPGALAEAKEGLAQAATSLELQNALGLAFLANGDLPLARFVFEKALSGTPGADKDASLRANMGRVYQQMGDAFRARAAFTEALALDAGNRTAQTEMARLYLDDHAYNEALALLERAAKSDPNNAALQLDLGIALRGTGALAEAEAAYRRALTLDPGDPAPYLNLGILLGDYLKRYGEGMDALQDYIKRGGPESERAKAILDDLKREMRDSERRKKAEADRKEREATREEQKKLLKGETPDRPLEPPPDETTPPVEGPPPEAPPPDQPPPGGRP